MTRRRPQIAAAAAVFVLAGLVGLLWRMRVAPETTTSTTAETSAPDGTASRTTAAFPPAAPTGGLTAAPVPPAHLPARLSAQAAPAVTPVGPPRFEGRVVAADTGEAIPSADLTFSRVGAAASALTDSNGAFQFEPPTEGRWLLAAVTATGFLPFAPEWGHSPIQLDARAGHEVRGLEIHLARAIAIEGRVVDEAGAPVKGAEVRLLGAAREATLVSVPDAFTSDADGRFTFVAPEGTVLMARREGFVPGRARVNARALLARRVTVRLGPPRDHAGAPLPVSGRVVAKGGPPLPGALILAYEERGSGAMDVPAAQTIASGDGRFKLPPLDPGRYRVTAQAEGRAPASVRRVSPGAKNLLLELPAGGRLRGCVRAASNSAPVAQFSVLVFERRRGLQLVQQRSLAVVDASGCYALDDLLPGRAAVVVSAPGFDPSPETAVEIPAEGEAVLDAALAAGGEIEGFVLDDATSAPIDGARVLVEGAPNAAASPFPVRSEAVSDGAGRFALRGLPRRFSLSVTAAGHHEFIVGGMEVPAGERAGPIEVWLRPAAPSDEPRVDLTGIGIEATQRGTALRISRTMPGGPAADVGLRRGDEILGVNGRPVTELGFVGAVGAIRGPEGTSVRLTVRRGDRTFDVQVPRRLVRG